MIASSIFIGFFATMLGALPPGASNIAVVKTTISNSTKESLKISYGAGLGEITLALIALFFGVVVKNFFIENIWVQYTGASIILLLGTYLIISRNAHKTKDKSINTKKRSKYMLGLTLGIINPPVLIYWVVVFSVLQGIIGSTENISTLWVLLFLTGVFMGKVLTLYGYSKLSNHFYEKKETSGNNINLYLGIALCTMGAIQLAKLLLF